MILVAINVGSSSVRVSAFDGAARRDAHLVLPDGADAAGAADRALARIDERPDVVVHRVVHGGARLFAPTVLDAATVAELRANVALAPLHLPRALAWIAAAERRWPDARSVAVFDTGLYATLPEVATTYALPPVARTRFGIRRYGFHGLAHRSMLETVGGAERVVTFQLGSGASVTASLNGRAIDTSMGFSPLEGLVMATRPGDVDAGALIHMLHRGLSVAELDRMLEHESGLRGLAGESEMKALLARQDDAARLAVAVYVQRARKYLGAFLAVLGGCDAIAFGGGVGENAAAVRAGILDGFGWAGIAVDARANAEGDKPRRFDARESRVALWVAAVDEAAVMRDEALTIL